MKHVGFLQAAAPAWLVSALAGLATVAAAPRTVVDLQPAAVHTTIAVGAGHTARLDDLAPGVHAWYLLTLDADSAHPAAFHLELAAPASDSLHLDASAGGRLVLEGSSAERCSIDLAPAQALETARRSARPFAPLCQGRLLLRNPVRGHRTALEQTTEFLRDHVWGGERIIDFVRHRFYADAFALHGASVPGGAMPDCAKAPPPPRLRAEAAGRTLVPADLGLDIGAAPRGAPLGCWLPVRERPGVFVNIVTPDAIADAPSTPTRPAWHPDPEEAAAIDYLVAFDLARFELGFALGTEHPRLGWSAHAASAQRDDRLPGPDGIDSAAPLVRTGLLEPTLVPRVVATFTGGFKREHGAFRSGPLSTLHRASHYGFMEQGVVLSTLQPGLSTLSVTTTGQVDIRTWRADDAADLPRLRHARQNGVPLVERGPDGVPALGAFVDQWGPGNWSGSADEQLRTLRAGACLIESDGRRFLVYGYFSTATPGTLARVFLAFGCRDAMHLDMNALEHTYLALYVHAGPRLEVEHLVQGMAVLDRQAGEHVWARFIDVADDRDFFYVLEKGPAP